jgi:hypothetical protein
LECGIRHYRVDTRGVCLGGIGETKGLTELRLSILKKRAAVFIAALFFYSMYRVICLGAREFFRFHPLFGSSPAWS